MKRKKLAMEQLNRLSPQAYAQTSKIPLVVVLDNIRSGHNIGSVFRTSDAFLVERILLCGITARPPHNDIRKSALGATETVPWEYHEQTIEALQQLKAEGYTIWAIEQAEHSISLDHLPKVEGPVAVVFGHEVKGVQQEVVDLADDCIEIPQFGTKHSLNVSVCSGIVIWEMFKKLR